MNCAKTVPHRSGFAIVLEKGTPADGSLCTAGNDKLSMSQCRAKKQNKRAL